MVVVVVLFDSICFGLVVVIPVGSVVVFIVMSVPTPFLSINL